LEWNLMDGVDMAEVNYQCIRVSVQVILDEATGQIEFHYKPEAEDTCGGGTTAEPGFSTGNRQTIGLRSGSTTVFTEQLTCNAGAGAGVLGVCDGAVPKNCSASKAYLFVPRHPSCP
jgi:hypothetical protein